MAAKDDKAPAPAITLTPEQFQQLLAAAQGHAASSADLAAAITQGMKQVSEPIPENKIGPDISAANPFGSAHPAPALKCDMWYGVIDDTDRDNPSAVKRAWEIDPRDCTIWEVLALNMLVPADTTIKRIDDEPMRVIVEGKTHQVTGQLERLIIAYPLALVGKKGENRNMIPDLTTVVYQLTKHDFRPDTLPYPEKADDLKFFLAEHRAGRYVAERPAVAA